MSDFIRADGRKLNEFRPLDIKLGGVPFCDGSSRVSLGGTVVEASVVGPTECSRRDEAIPDATKLTVTYAVSEHGSNQRGSMMMREQQAEAYGHWLSGVFGAVVHRALYPETEILVHISVQVDAGSALAAALLAGSTALLQAGVPITGPLVGVTAGYISTVDVATGVDGAGDALDRAGRDLALDLLQAEEDARDTAAALFAVNFSGIVGMGSAGSAAVPSGQDYAALSAAVQPTPGSPVCDLLSAAGELCRKQMAP